MVQVRDLTGLTVRDRWQEVKDEEGWCGDPDAATVRGEKRLLGGMETEIIEEIRAGAYQYLLLDGITMKVKGVTGVKKRLVFCAYGITPEGQREMIGFRQAASESEAR